ncbi:MAG: MAPEG family protein [Hyphomonas sp.]
MPVSYEFFVLGLAILLGMVHIVLASHSASFQNGYAWTASSREAETPPLRGAAGRLQRAFANFCETFPFFAAAILMAHVRDIHDWRTVWGAGLYLGGRTGFLLLYAFGVPIVRSLVWNVATVGILLVLWAALGPAG